ncbi:1-acyl-sn-glycerol-3-phosphate acyltransferase beta [Polypterus senegalus]|uniref:1-acyl-sn-glycerol-3-phosphate acyltransferase beta n=1 Tax=Polypterus senegalus TaxID=55291 RepID=UPI0019624F7E|nr:1-acyl-sn-glycerol-3-phosphate acyltransferase beta [Polypterus senegalus]
MDALTALALLLVLLLPVLLASSHTFVYHFKNVFYVAWMMVIGVVAIPLCLLSSGWRNVDNMRILAWLTRHVKHLLGLKYHVSGLEHLELEGSYVVISNHQSSLDVLGMMEILPDRCTAIAKKELLYAGTVGLVCWLGGVIFINRQKTSDAKSVMAEAAETMLREKLRVWIFPEGTRNLMGSILPFKKGAFHLAVQAQVPIIPVVFSSYSNFYKQRERRFNSGTITMKVLPRIKTKGLTANDASTLSESAHKLMLATFHEISALTAEANGAHGE